MRRPARRPRRPRPPPCGLPRRMKSARATQASQSNRFDRIERLLAAADDDFQPAGSIGPEVELCFDNSAHPFQQEFAEEEVVADHYAAVALAAATEKTVAASLPARPMLETSASTAPPLAVAPPAEAEEELVGANASPRTEDHLVREPEPERRPAPPPMPGAPSRRREYRQLFARPAPRVMPWACWATRLRT